MNVTVNGQALELQDGATVGQLVESKAQVPARVAVEVNAKLVPRGQFGDTALSPGDVVEIVTLVGGG